MMNEAIIGKLFDLLKEQYGSTVADPLSLFGGQQDLLSYVMGLGRALEQSYSTPWVPGADSAARRGPPPLEECRSCEVQGSSGRSRSSVLGP